MGEPASLSTPVRLSVDDLARVCVAVNAECRAFGGNCGTFAIALRRVLGVGELVAVCVPLDDDLGMFYHVAYSSLDGVLFDGNGRLTKSEMATWVQRYRDEFPSGECPTVEVVDLGVRPDPERDVLDGTSFTVAIGTYEGLIRGAIAQLSSLTA